MIREVVTNVSWCWNNHTDYNSYITFRTIKMAQWTIRWLKNIDPDVRLFWAARLLWASILLGVLSVIFLCNSGFERVLMAISWGPITVTCMDIVATTDVRDEEGGG